MGVNLQLGFLQLAQLEVVKRQPLLAQRCVMTGEEARLAGGDIAVSRMDKQLNAELALAFSHQRLDE